MRIIVYKIHDDFTVLERKNNYYNSYSKRLYTSVMKSNKIKQNDSDYVNSKKGIFYMH